ncbi:unnamed protein product [Bursaphelenchus xylophilus]|uniref:GMP synthase (glutamine-hydrolyzing) n=1 Tax=Bursaphelenchus xylophilus TaxID=6326 RepID=A0A1I7RPJ9_BURXY|nr:unnamed protein product [Bursaphelenchus xylophilus]CAG9096144.1 unnamed protein product [Bursaphelenchus xylophilus]
MKRAASAKSVSDIIRKSAFLNECGTDNGVGSTGLILAEMTAMDVDITEKVAILDFGAQYGKVIDRRVRECNVYTEMLPLSTSAADLKERDYKAIIISGGPQSVYAADAPTYDPAIFDLGVPILGICYGFQIINKHFGGTVANSKIRSDGVMEIKVNPKNELFVGLSDLQSVLLTHGDSVKKDCVAPGFQVIAHTIDEDEDRIIVAGICNEEKKIYGVQFHPEVDLTKEGVSMFNQFLHSIAGISSHYTIANREQMCIDHIKEVVGDKNVLVMVSGGVDSTVCAALLHKALGAERVVAIHIDNGFMRYKESEAVVSSLNKLGLDVKCFYCIDTFLNAKLSQNTLRFVTNPEEKRMIIGDTFIRCKDNIVEELKLNTDMFFAQGTLRPDLIESASALASGCADTIKTHHNDTALVRELRDLGKVIEPLKDFHKDEVRELGRALGLPETIVNRHPFPGPGLAIRIICAEKPFVGDLFNETAESVNREVTETLGEEFFGRVMPIRTVGVQGDKRTYSYAAVLSTSLTNVPWEVVDKFAKKLPGIAKALNRVCFAFGEPIQSPILDITPTRLSEGVIEKLRKVDHIVTQVLNGLNFNGEKDPNLPVSMHMIQQMPVVLIPIQFGYVDVDNSIPHTVLHSIVLRPFITRDFMTGTNALPGRDIPVIVFETIVRRIMTEVPLISRVLLDLTSKPPGTTEWE